MAEEAQKKETLIDIKAFNNLIGKYHVVADKGQLCTVPVDRAVMIVKNGDGEYKDGKEPKACTEYRKANNIK